MNVDWPEIMSRVVHDVRSLARKGLSNAQLLEREAGDKLDAGMQTQLAAVVASQRDLDRLMAQLRGLVEATSAEHALLWADVQDLETLVLHARIEQQASFSACGAQLIVEPLPAASLPMKLHVVIGELLRNAVQFRTQARPLEARIRGEQVSDERLRLHIEDNGEGWDSAFTDRLFQPFHRLTATAGGFGLGLAIARGWVEAAGGTIAAESANGTTRFTVELPSQAAS